MDCPDGPVPAELIYGADESCFFRGFQVKERVVGSAEAKMVWQTFAEDREITTVMACGAADGSHVRPFVIFKAEHQSPAWRYNNVANCAFGNSPNGWTDNELTLWWLTHVFDADTREKANGRRRVLLVDGHGSHLTLEFINYARQANITVLCYPPHTTHLLQGLDVVAFAQLKRTYARHVKAFEAHTGRSVRKGDFGKVFGHAFLEAFTPTLIKKMFEATGVVPFNPSRINTEKLKPSKAISVAGTFPLEQPKVVRIVMAAFGPLPTTSPVRAPLLNYDGTAMHIDPALAGINPVQTPRRGHVLTAADYTPQSRWRNCQRAICADEETSFLLSTGPITAAQVDRLNPTPEIERIPESMIPNWGLINDPKATVEELRTQLAKAMDYAAAQRTINEALGGKMVVQNLLVKQLNKTLHGRESLDADRAAQKAAPAGIAKHLGRAATDDQFAAVLATVAAEKAVRETEAAERKRVKEANKRARQEADEQWVAMKAAHATALESWQAEWDQQAADSVPKKSRAIKPKLGRKPEAVLIRQEAAVEEQEAEDVDEEVEDLDA